MEPTANAARVLVAEDNPQGAELLEAYISGAGYYVRIAADGDSGLAHGPRVEAGLAAARRHDAR